MATTTKITSTVKISEFAELTDALLDAMFNQKVFGYTGRYNLIIDLLEKQTWAKQKKFWKYFDSVTIRCEECGLSKYSHLKVIVGSKKGAFCSRECAYKAMGVVRIVEEHPLFAPKAGA